MTMHEEWTDRLSEYLDDELSPAERADVEAHLGACRECTAVLEDLKHVVTRARDLTPRHPRTDLWSGIEERLGAKGFGIEALPARRFTFTFAQLSAAAVLLIAASATVAITLMAPVRGPAAVSTGPAETARREQPPPELPPAVPPGDDLDDVAPVSLADAQYGAAVADLEKAVRQGRGRLDASTIAIVEHNLQIIDQAIAQAREALAADSANTYLTGHLVEARRRKLDLLRRAAALAETN